MRSFSKQYGAHVALGDVGRQLAPLVLGHAERAGDHAVAAADALAAVVAHCTLGGLGDAADRADRGAGRVFTVQAHAADKLVAAWLDGREGGGRQRRFGIPGLLVPRFAGSGALLAADAFGDIDQQTFGFLAHR